MAGVCPELPDELWSRILRYFCKAHGLYAAKRLRPIARVSVLFWQHTPMHPDNIVQ